MVFSDRFFTGSKKAAVNTAVVNWAMCGYR